MLWLSSLCVLLGGAVVWVLIRREYAHLRATPGIETSLEWLDASPGLSESPSRTTSRVDQALRTWTSQRAATDLSVPPVEYRAFEPVTPRPRWQTRAPEPTPVFVPPVTRESAPEAAPEPVRPQAIAPDPEPPVQDPADEALGATTFTLTPRDHYEVLQISAHADIETIHRVYRIMASRFHPDNRVTGDVERFLLLTQAYKVLSDPARRAQYDATLGVAPSGAHPIFGMKVFIDGVEGENNRRLGVLSLLYHRRRLNDSHPGLSVLELERRMAFPREYLHFTLWYLRSKGYVGIMEDNSDYMLTATGVDYVEANASTNSVIRELLTAGSRRGTAEARNLPLPERSTADGQESDAAEPLNKGAGLHRPRHRKSPKSRHVRQIK